jgi:hypothetical protein
MVVFACLFITGSSTPPRPTTPQEPTPLYSIKPEAHVSRICNHMGPDDMGANS